VTSEACRCQSRAARRELHVGGDYVDDGLAVTPTQAYLVNEVNGAWADVTEVPGTETLNRGDVATVTEVSCSADSACGVVGRSKMPPTRPVSS